MRVSVVITNYNYAAYLAEAIDSALGQDYPDTEVIVIDDGSTDDSAAVIRGYGDRVRAVFRENGGHVSCCDAGLELASGDVLVFLDSDDVLLPNAVSLHVDELRDPAVVGSCGYMTVVDSDGKPTGHRIPAVLPPSGDYLQATLDRGLEVYRSSFTSGHAWPRAFLERVMPLPEEDMIGPDGYLTAIDRLFGKLAFIHEPVALYRVHNRNKGPILFRFEREYMRRQVERKQHRIRFAKSWIDRLGYEVNAREFYKVRDWRLNVMRHALRLMGAGGEHIPVVEFATTPLRNVARPSWRATLMTLCLLAVRLMPRPLALETSRYLLTRTELPRA